MVEKISTRLDSSAYRDNPIIVEKINELCDAVNDILDQKSPLRQLHDAVKAADKAAEKTEPLAFKVEASETVISKNIELQAENLRLQQDLNRVCNVKYEELDTAVRKSNENLFNENQKLKQQLAVAMDALSGYARKDMWNTCGYGDTGKNGYIYAQTAIDKVHALD